MARGGWSARGAWAAAPNEAREDRLRHAGRMRTAATRNDLNDLRERVFDCASGRVGCGMPRRHGARCAARGGRLRTVLFGPEDGTGRDGAGGPGGPAGSGTTPSPPAAARAPSPPLSLLPCVAGDGAKTLRGRSLPLLPVFECSFRRFFESSVRF